MAFLGAAAGGRPPAREDSPPAVPAGSQREEDGEAPFIFQLHTYGGVATDVPPSDAAAGHGQTPSCGATVKQKKKN